MIRTDSERIYGSKSKRKISSGSPQKARLVIDMIRGKNVNQALAILRYSNKRAALGIEKCVKSAIANANEAAEKAEHRGRSGRSLGEGVLSSMMGPTKIVAVCARRRRVVRYREQRHFCHVTILVSSEQPKARTGRKRSRQ